MRQGTDIGQVRRMGYAERCGALCGEDRDVRIRCSMRCRDSGDEAREWKGTVQP